MNVQTQISRQLHSDNGNRRGGKKVAALSYKRSDIVRFYNEAARAEASWGWGLALGRTKALLIVVTRKQVEED